MAKLKSLFVAFLTIAASAQKLGINLIRVAILVIFVWIGGLKFWNYEAEGYEFFFNLAHNLLDSISSTPTIVVRIPNMTRTSHLLMPGYFF